MGVMVVVLVMLMLMVVKVVSDGCDGGGCDLNM